MDPLVSAPAEEAHRRVVAVHDEGGNHLQPLPDQGLLAGAQEASGDPSPLVCWVHGETVDPALPGVVCAEHGPHETLAVERAEVRAFIQSKLAGERAPGITSVHAARQAGLPPQANHRLIILEPEPSDSDRHRLTPPARRAPSRGRAEE